MRIITIALTLSCLILSGCAEDVASTTGNLGPDPTDPTSAECANEVKAEALAAAEAGTPYDYVGQLAARCGVTLGEDPGSAPPEPEPDPATVACANEVKAEALAAAEAGTPYDYAGQLAARCGIVLPGTDTPPP